MLCALGLPGALLRNRVIGHERELPRRLVYSPNDCRLLALSWAGARSPQLHARFLHGCRAILGQGAGLDIERAGLEPAPIWEAGIAGGGLTPCVRVSARERFCGTDSSLSPGPVLPEIQVTDFPSRMFSRGSGQVGDMAKVSLLWNGGSQRIIIIQTLAPLS